MGVVLERLSTIGSTGLEGIPNLDGTKEVYSLGCCGSRHKAIGLRLSLEATPEGLRSFQIAQRRDFVKFS